MKFQLESTDMPDIGTPADALQESILYRAYVKGKTAFSKSFKKVITEYLFELIYYHSARSDFHFFFLITCDGET